MGFWHGMLKSGKLEMDATINYNISPEAFIVKWTGSGLSHEKWPSNKMSTNVGIVEVESVKEKGSDDYFIEFKGINNPTGPLAIEIGKEL